MQPCFWWPSSRLARLQGILGLLAGLAVAFSGMPYQARAVLGIFCLCWACWRFAGAAGRHKAADCRGLRHQRADGWQLWRSDRGWQQVRVLAGSLVTRHLVVLRLQAEADGRRRETLVIPSDVLDADSHRRLRLWLRLIPLAGRAAESSPAFPAADPGSPG